MTAASNVISLPYNWTPRDYQEDLWAALEAGIKRAFLYWHRRSGKDLTMLNWIAVSAFQRVGAYWHVFPTYRQGRKIAWEGKTFDGRRFIDHFPEGTIARIRDQEMTIDFINGSSYHIVGADNPDSQVGTNPVGLVFSEYAVLDGNEIWIYLQPILAENDGWAIFITTPRGRNHAYRLYKDHLDDSEWFCQKLSYKTTHAISEEAVARAIREGMSPALAAQEFECSFDAALEHSWWGAEMSQALEDDRIGKYPHMKDFPVETWWDIGTNDATAIWYAQKHQGMIRIIDYDHAIGTDHPHWMAVLSKKRDEFKYNYSEHLLPHDVKVKEWGTGLTRLERFYKSGIRNVRVIPKLDKLDGINAVRAALSRCQFNEDTTIEGIEALMQYARKPLIGQTDNKNQQVYSDQAVHDWASDGADAFRTGIVGSRPIRQPSEDHEILAPDIAIV